ncbi:MFS transporter [Aquabacterium sp.]|uniref:MFS transporter n=1 Tax=Aquabacterium sp. TaxID=1872578 RepID=UPI0025BC7AA9|nr:MFS transporter [Aquabacterium sp.]
MQSSSGTLSPLSSPKALMAWVALLYFSEGLPLGLFYDLFPVNLRQAGVGPAEIGLLSLLGLAWTVKFLWAPLIDAWRGHRWWIAGANAGMALVLVALALHPQALGQGATWPWALLAAFTMLSATNDIATDGYTIELLSKGQYGVANGLRIGFYRVGMLAAGGMLVVAGAMGEPGQPNWAAAYGLGAVLMLINGLSILMAPAQPPRAARDEGASAREWAAVREQPLWLLALGLVMAGLLWPVLGPIAKAAGWQAIQAVSGTWWFKGAVPVGLMFAGAGMMVTAARGPQAHAMADGPIFGAWVELLARPGMLSVLLFILLFKLGDAAMGFMVKPFWVDAGFTPAQIGLVSVNVGLGLSIAGGLAGGWYVDRVGIFKGLWVLGLAQAVSNLGYALAAWYVPHTEPGLQVSANYQMAVYAASGLESFTSGLGTGAFMAFLMGITSKERATTEYAILSSIFAFSRAVAGWAGGLGVEQMGYATFFFLTFWLSFPAYLLLPAVRRMLNKADVR